MLTQILFQKPQFSRKTHVLEDLKVGERISGEPNYEKNTDVLENQILGPTKITVIMAST